MRTTAIAPKTPDYYSICRPSRRPIRTRADWRIRRETYHHLLGHVLAAGPQPLRVLDLGAGSGWLSHRLASLGHHAVAVDAIDDAVDGLGAARHYASDFVRVQADFDALPFAPAQFDLVIFNGSLHYAPDTAATLAARTPHARAGRCAGGDGFADVPRRERRSRDGRDGLCAVRRRLRRQRRRAAGHRLSDLRHARRIAERLELQQQFIPSRGPLGWRAAAPARALPAAAGAGGVRPVGGAMIVLFNPISTTPGKQPLPLSLMALAAVLEGAATAGRSSTATSSADPAAEIIERLVGSADARTHRCSRVTVMPGPQLAQAVTVCRRVKAALPHVPIVWGGYFPTQHTDTVLAVAVRRLRRAVAGRAARCCS